MVDLTDLTHLPTACPVLVHHTDDHGQVVSLAVRVTGTFAARRLRALFEVAHLHTFTPECHPACDTCDTLEGAWVLTANGNAGRLSGCSACASCSRPPSSVLRAGGS
jgi:hypothetical protein